MTERNPTDAGFDRGWREQRQRQATAGLSLTHAERLRWLEQTMATMRRWLGRARHGQPMHPTDPETRDE